MQARVLVIIYARKVRKANGDFALTRTASAEPRSPILGFSALKTLNLYVPPAY
jgi:hypothetical protein